MSHFHQAPHTFVKQVSINVTDLEHSLAFYQDILGFKLLQKTQREAVLTADGKTAIVTLVEPEDVIDKKERTTGLYHFALLLPTRQDLPLFLNHLVAHSYQLGASDHVVSEAIYIDDPDGNGIEVYRDRSASSWEWTENQVKMTSDPLRAEKLLALSDGVWNGLPSETIMGHIHLHVRNVEETEVF